MQAPRLLALTSFLTAASASASSVMITSHRDQPDPTRAALSDVPQQVLGILLDQGLAMQDLGGGRLAVVADGIHCDYRHRGAIDGPYSGIPTQVCRINSAPARDSQQGQLFGEGRALDALLARVQDADLGVYFGDCAMGYCGTWVKQIRCTIDESIDTFSDGRFACSFDDSADEGIVGSTAAR